MRPATPRAGESSPPPASDTNWREQFAYEQRERLSDAEKRRLRKARTRARIKTVAILTDREREIAAQRVQIVEHRRTVTSYLGGARDAK